MSMSNAAFNKDPRDIILSPVVSEKSYGLIDEGKYTFIVDPRSNKTEIKLAIEKSEQYGESNQIKGFKALPGGFAVPAAATALSTFKGGSAATGAAVPTAKVAPPWAKK